ncbi:MAG: hypothetical protein HQ518_04110 [Rhodopirellula sp.]|nr:hypothetical protein [Rhodopirellula sp.]
MKSSRARRYCFSTLGLLVLTTLMQTAYSAESTLSIEDLKVADDGKLTFSLLITGPLKFDINRKPTIKVTQQKLTPDNTTGELKIENSELNTKFLTPASDAPEHTRRVYEVVPPQASKSRAVIIIHASIKESDGKFLTVDKAFVIKDQKVVSDSTTEKEETRPPKPAAEDSALPEFGEVPTRAVDGVPSFGITTFLEKRMNFTAGPPWPLKLDHEVSETLKKLSALFAELHNKSVAASSEKNGDAQQKALSEITKKFQDEITSEGGILNDPQFPVRKKAWEPLYKELDEFVRSKSKKHEIDLSNAKHRAQLYHELHVAFSKAQAEDDEFQTAVEHFRTGGFANSPFFAGSGNTSFGNSNSNGDSFFCDKCGKCKCRKACALKLLSP